MPFRRSSLYRIALGPLSVAASAAVVVAAGLIAVIYDTQVYQNQKLQEVEVQAQILSGSVAGALAFDDKETATQTVRALYANPLITAAAVYGPDGTIFASFVRDPDDPAPAAAQPGAPRFENGQAVATLAVMQNSRRLGTVYLRSLQEPVSRRIVRYGGLILLLLMGSLVFIVLSSARRELAEKNEELEARNRLLVDQIEATEKAEAALRQSQKMEALGQLTGGIAHDFNNMLAIVIGSLGLLKRRAARGETNLEKFADSALDGAQRAAALTQRLLAFSRQQALRPEAVDVNKLMTGISELLRRSLGETIRIETVLGADLWRTHVDPHELENAVLNLAVNSRDAMPGGGKLTIETANHSIAGRVAGDEELKPGQYVMLVVTDTGSGMAPDVIAKAFDPFFTTKGIGKGTGLGLSQVYGFVRQSGGHIRIDSEIGQGTAVKIYLPRYLGPVEKAAGHTPSPVKADHDGPTVLAVEDEPSVRAFAMSALTELGYRAIEATSAAEALDLLQTNPEISILFTDVVMPVMNGRQLADEARKVRPDLKVLFTTGYTRNAVVHNGVLEPGLHLLSKPFTIDQLGAALQEIRG